MEEIMFQVYLKYIKDKNLPVWRATRRFDKSKFFVIFVPIIFFIGGIILLALAFSEKYSSLFYKYKSFSPILMFMTIIIMIPFSKLRLIKNKFTDLNEYYNYCDELTNLLNRYDCATVQAIDLLCKRLLHQITEIETTHKELCNRIEKWVQVFVFPIILLTITKIIDLSASFSDKLILLFFVLFSCLAIWSIALFYLNLAWFSPKCELEQRKCFVDDLQGILDLQCIRNSNEVIPHATVTDSNKVNIDTSVNYSKKSKRKHK